MSDYKIPDYMSRVAAKKPGDKLTVEELACALYEGMIAGALEITVAALEQQLAAKDAEIAAAQAALREILWESQRLCQIYGINHSGYRGCLRDRIAALAETPAAPLTALALPEDDVPDAAPEVK